MEGNIRRLLVEYSVLQTKGAGGGIGTDIILLVATLHLSTLHK